jgi:hypothetical protein
MKKNTYFLILISLVFFNFSYADNIPVFVGGLHEKTLAVCYQDVLVSCKAKQLDSENLSCFQGQMAKQDTCDQGLAFLKASNGTVEKIEHHQYIDVVYATVIAADHSDDFFMIGHAGDFVNLLGTPDLNIRKASGYKKIAKRFPGVILWPVSDASLDFPKHVQLKSGGDRIIFQQEMTNECLACEKAGVAQVAYDFDTQGKFIGASIIRLFPPVPAPEKGAEH